MNEPVKHAARDVRHSWKGTCVILFIHGAEVVRCIETKWQDSAGPGRGRGNWCSNGSFNPGRWDCPGDGWQCLQACTPDHVTVHIAHTCAPPPSLLAHLWKYARTVLLYEVVYHFIHYRTLTDLNFSAGEKHRDAHTSVLSPSGEIPPCAIPGLCSSDGFKALDPYHHNTFRLLNSISTKHFPSSRCGSSHTTLTPMWCHSR